MKSKTNRSTLWPLVPLVSLLILVVSAEEKKNIVPRPNDPIPKAEVKNLTGDWKEAKLSRDIRILWLCGPEDHYGGAHDYIRIKELFVPMLKTISRVTVDEAFEFPTQDQFDRADLLIQYLRLPDLTDKQFAMFQAFVDRGGSVVSIHESCIIRPVDRAEKLAGCIGCAWKGNKESKWSKFDHSYPLFLNTKHPAFAGLPQSVRFNDESYWNLLTRDNVEVIGALAPAALAKDTSFADALASPEARGDTFWTYTSGKGKVFGTTTGHYTYTFYDPIYRLLLLRGIAWTLDEDPAPFMPLVLQGNTDDQGLVGTTDTMLEYENRKQQ